MNYTELVPTICSYVQNYESDFIAQLPVIIRQAEQRIYNSVQFPSLRKNATLTLVAGDQYLLAPTDFLAVYSIAVYSEVSPTATGTAGERVIVVNSASGITLGQNVTGTGIAAGAIVTGISGTTIALSDKLTATVSGTVLFQSDYTYLLNKDVNFIRQAYPNPNAKSLPLYYSIFGPALTDDEPNDYLQFILGPTPDAAYKSELHYYYYPESITTAADGETWLGNNFDTVLLYGSLIEAYTFLKGEADLLQLYEGKYKEAMALAKRLGDGMDRQDAYRSGQFRQPVT